jgi:hypothetical protein
MALCLSFVMLRLRPIPLMSYTFRAVGARSSPLVISALLVSLSACSKTADTPPATVTIASGTQRMVDSLAALNARAIRMSDGNPFLNRARATALSAALAGASGPQAMETRFELAEEQLKQGLTQQAIDGLESLIADAGIRWDSILPHQKPFFDLAAVAYMRLGEQQNCLDNAAANICIARTGCHMSPGEPGGGRSGSFHVVVV